MGIVNFPGCRPFINTQERGSLSSITGGVKGRKSRSKKPSESGAISAGLFCASEKRRNLIRPPTTDKRIPLAQ